MSGQDAQRKRIERLDPHLASRIAAGEVIERPVSAAKELLENALDAGATDVRISLEQGGKVSLVIEDDGAGIPFGEMPLALERYATSKIRTLEDLECVRTLGYRGEALSSIAAVSRLEIRSRTRDADAGGMIVCHGGQFETHVEMPLSRGTRIQVDDLFYNLPPRRKFMKSATAELKRILQVVQDYALVHPQTRFRVVNDGRQLLDIGAAASTDDVLCLIWGTENRAVSANAASGAISVSLWWNNLPGSRRVTVTTFVNGRRVQDPTIRAALNSTGASIYGEWVVMIDLPPEEVDVNIHPAKAEVRFRKTGPIFEIVRRATKDALLKGGGFHQPSSEMSSAQTPEADPWENYVPPPEHMQQTSFLSSTPPPSAATSSERTLFSEEDLGPERKYLGQAQGGYLVFDDRRGLCLVDAHAAHERILFEEIEDAYAGKKIDTQQLVIEQELPPGVTPGVALHRETLAEMGFVFRLQQDSDGGGEGAAIVSVPVLRGLARLSPLEMLRSALRGIEEESDPSKRDREVWWRWARTACRDAIKLGDRVEPAEAIDLLDRLERCRSPYSCPHGRPTTIFLAGDKLKSWFER